MLGFMTSSNPPLSLALSFSLSLNRVHRPAVPHSWCNDDNLSVPILEDAKAGEEEGIEYLDKRAVDVDSRCVFIAKEMIILDMILAKLSQ